VQPAANGRYCNWDNIINQAWGSVNEKADRLFVRKDINSPPGSLEFLRKSKLSRRLEYRAFVEDVTPCLFDTAIGAVVATFAGEDLALVHPRLERGS
jgi:hypothetical protein